MLKSFVFIFSILFLFSGCFSLSFLNPFSDEEKKETLIETPDDAPIWAKEIKETGYINTLGISKIKKNDDFNFVKKKALIFAGNSLSQKIYLKTLSLYKDYEKNLSNSNLFNKDLENSAKQVALKSLQKSIIRNTWTSKDNILYVKISISSNFVAEEIQTESKKLFKTDKNLYSNFLSNRSKEKILKHLEK